MGKGARCEQGLPVLDLYGHQLPLQADFLSFRLLAFQFDQLRLVKPVIKGTAVRKLGIVDHPVGRNRAGTADSSIVCGKTFSGPTRIAIDERNNRFVVADGERITVITWSGDVR